MSVSQLRGLPSIVRHGVYWEGPRAGVTYEVTRYGNGNVTLRYLPSGVPIGTAAQDYPAVASYPVAHAFSAAQQGAKHKGALVFHLRGGGLAVSQAPIPHSVYVAYPGSTVLIEVYDPSVARARQLVRSGQITAIR